MPTCFWGNISLHKKATTTKHRPFVNTHLKISPLPPLTMAVSTMVRLLTTPCGSPGYSTCHIATWIWNLVPLALLCVGTCGNVLSFAVLFRRRMRKHSTSVYVTFLAMSDLCFLYSSVLNTSFKKIFGIQLELRSSFNCAFAEFMIYVSGTFSLYLLLLMTIERVLFTKIPFFARAKMTRNNAVIIASCTLVAVVFLTGHLIFGRELHYEETTVVSENGNETIIAFEKKCSPVARGYTRFYLTWWGYMVLFVVNFIPLFLIVIGNAIIAITLIQQARKVKPNIPSQITTITGVAPISKQTQQLENKIEIIKEANQESVKPCQNDSLKANHSEQPFINESHHSTATSHVTSDVLTNQNNPASSSNDSLEAANKNPPNSTKSQKEDEKRLEGEPRSVAPTPPLTIKNNGQHEVRSSRIRGATKLLFIMSAFSVCTVTPFCSFNIYMKSVNADEMTESRLATDQLLFSIIYCLVLSNFALNFFWYFITGTLFKNELKSMLEDAKVHLRNLYQRIMG